MTSILPRTPSASKDSRSTSVSATITVRALHDASADKAPVNLLPQGFCPERTRVRVDRADRSATLCHTVFAYRHDIRPECTHSVPELSTQSASRQRFADRPGRRSDA